MGPIWWNGSSPSTLMLCSTPTTKINCLVNQSTIQCIFKVKYLTWVDIAAPRNKRLLSENAGTGAGYHPMSCWSWRLQGPPRQRRLPTTTVLGCLPELDDETLLLNTPDTSLQGIMKPNRNWSMSFLLAVWLLWCWRVLAGHWVESHQTPKVKPSLPWQAVSYLAVNQNKLFSL